MLAEVKKAIVGLVILASAPLWFLPALLLVICWVIGHMAMFFYGVFKNAD